MSFNRYAFDGRTPKSKRFASAAPQARWLCMGEKARGIVGVSAWLIIFSPAGARSDHPVDRLLFYGATGVLCHEEEATPEALAEFGFS